MAPEHVSNGTPKRLPNSTSRGNLGPTNQQTPRPGVRAQSRLMNARAPTFTPRRVNAPDVSDWRRYSSMAIRLRGLPDHVTTWDIYHSLEPIVNITRIDLEENFQGNRDGTARVQMEPPSRNHWTTGFCLIKNETSEPIRVRVEIESRSFFRSGQAIQSPLGETIPAKMHLTAATMQFGFMHQKSTMMNMCSLEPQPSQEPLALEIDFKLRWIRVYFSVTLGGSQSRRTTQHTMRYKMEIRFSYLTELCRQDLPSGKSAVIFPLSHAPFLWRKLSDVQSTHLSDKPSWQELDLWHRQVNIMHDPRRMKDAVVTLNKENQVIDIGRWTTYRFELDDEATRIWARMEKHLSDYSIKTKSEPDFSLLHRQDASIWDVLDHSPTTMTSAQSAISLLQSSPVQLPFEARYQLEVCISRGILNEHNIDVAFLSKLADMIPEHARDILEFLADRGTRVFSPSEVFSDPDALGFVSQLDDVVSREDYLVKVRKVIVTPTTIVLSTPAIEANNRVIRHYSAHKDRFLRVQFTDELPEGRINPSADVSKNDELFTRIFRTLVNGIRIGERHYKLLAFGNSQLRENGAYFFAPTEHLTCEEIRTWMGDFSKIKNIAKYGARLGQCFSTTRLISGFGWPQVKTTADIHRNGYCFTDGVGKISKSWAEMIADHLKVNQVPSAFQFRMGGCKGVLTVWPDAKRNEVHIRPSQEKFTGAIFNGLEIIRHSETTTPMLNRQSIVILSTLGVRDEAFHDLLDEEIAGLNNAMNDVDSAVEHLIRRVDQNHTTETMAKMARNGFMEVNEPFMWTLLQLWRSWTMKGLREKTRITVVDGAFVLGCVDETETLRGHDQETERSTEARRDPKQLPQIFLQVPDRRNSGQYKVITGLCVVGRNPSLHPGDIRVVEAVDAPSLRDLKDVVVFSSLGDRDVPSMCSGGDLDGDDFFVIWDKNLLPPASMWNCPPMNYAAPPAPEVEDITLKDLSAFFVLYMKNDSLPTIAHAHMAQADRLDGHVAHPKCLELAELHSKAVDYVKTSVPAVMHKRLAPREWPHWMEKRGKSYHSEEILGQLYDKVKLVDFHPVYDKPFDNRILTRYVLDGEVLQKARRLKNQYDTALRRLMGLKEINTEFEVWSGFILSKPRKCNNYKLSEEIGREAAVLKARFRDLCIQQAGGSLIETLGPFVAAMYKVTQEEVRIALHENHHTGSSPQKQKNRLNVSSTSMPLISFPWLFDRELGLIATGASREPDIYKHARHLPSLPDPTSGGYAKEMDHEEMKEMGYVRDENGKVTHRGMPLTLFDKHHDDDDSDTRVAEAASEDEVEIEIVEEIVQPKDNVLTRAARLFGE